MRRFALLVAGLALLAGLAAGVSGGATQAQTRWVITDLGTLGGKSSEAVAINERGQVVGSADTKAGNSHAFLWQNGKMRDLGTLGAENSWASAINERGQIVGTSTTGKEDEDGDEIHRAFIWQDGEMRDLGRLGVGWDETYAGAINERGQVIGHVSGQSGSVLSFLWQNRKMIDLGTLGGRSRALAINDHGQIVGVSSAHAFLWQNGRMASLARRSGNAEVSISAAQALNEHGQIVGWARTARYTEHAVLWEGNRQRDLGSLGRNSYAFDINERGQIVGWSGVARNVLHAFLWQDGRMRDLGFAHRDSYADETVAINDRGQIVVDSRDAGVFVWRDGWAARLRTLGGRVGIGSTRSVLNNRGQIVGWAETKSGDKHAVLWTKRG